MRLAATEEAKAREAQQEFRRSVETVEKREQKERDEAAAALALEAEAEASKKAAAEAKKAAKEAKEKELADEFKAKIDLKRKACSTPCLGLLLPPHFSRTVAANAATTLLQRC